MSGQAPETRTRAVSADRTATEWPERPTHRAFVRGSAGRSRVPTQETEADGPGSVGAVRPPRRGRASGGHPFRRPQRGPATVHHGGGSNLGAAFVFAVGLPFQLGVMSG